MTRNTFNTAIYPNRLSRSGVSQAAPTLRLSGRTSISRVRVGIFMGLVSLWSVGLMDSAFAVDIESLKEPMKDFKKEIFGGWMIAAKIGAFAGGLVMSLFRGSAMPALTGIGVTTGIVFFDKYLGDGAAGALI